MSVQDQITQAANSAGVPAWLALRIAQRESSYNNSAIGSAGEIGIFQLLPSTAAQLGVDPHDPVQNIAGGVAYLAQLLRTFGGDVQKAAAAFNCGPTCVARAISSGGDGWASLIPSSTQAYVASVTGSLPTAAPQDASAVVSIPWTVPDPLASGTVALDWEPWALAAGGLFTFLLLRRIGQQA